MTKQQDAVKKFPTAAQRTVSLFTGKTDLEDAKARDGSDPDPEDRETMRMRPKVKWTRIEGLAQYHADRISAAIYVEREGAKKDGAWTYRVLRRGQHLGMFDSICAAADAAESEL